MPKVTFLGTSASYTRNGKRWTKNGPSIDVTDEEWSQMRRLHDHANRRLFMLDDNADNDDEINAMADDSFAVGNFITKQSAIEYVRDMMDVELDSNVSLTQLNEQTMFLKERYDVGRRGEHLVEGVKGAVAINPEPIEDTDHATTGEIDTAMEGARRTRHTQEMVEERVGKKRTMKTVSPPRPTTVKRGDQTGRVVRQGTIRTITSEA